MKKAILSLLILISFSAFSQNVVIFQNGNTQPMQFITDSLKQRVDSCSTAIQNGGGVTTGTPNGVRYFNGAGRDTSNSFIQVEDNSKTFFLNDNLVNFLAVDPKIFRYIATDLTQKIYFNITSTEDDGKGLDNAYNRATISSPDSSAQFGINTIAPTAALDIVGNVKFESLTNTPNPANKMMVIDSLTKAVAYVDMPVSGGGATVGDSLVNLKQRVDSLSTALQAIGGAATLVYSGYFTQTGTNDPVVTILQNTVGNIVWVRSGVGTYIGTLSGAFAEFKTKPYSFTSTFNTSGVILAVERQNNNSLIAAFTNLGSNSNIDISDIGTSFYIEIKVYQ